MVINDIYNTPKVIADDCNYKENAPPICNVPFLCDLNSFSSFNKSSCPLVPPSIRTSSLSEWLAAFYCFFLFLFFWLSLYPVRIKPSRPSFLIMRPKDFSCQEVFLLLPFHLRLPSSGLLPWNSQYPSAAPYITYL